MSASETLEKVKQFVPVNVQELEEEVKRSQEVLRNESASTLGALKSTFDFRREGLEKVFCFISLGLAIVIVLFFFLSAILMFFYGSPGVPKNFIPKFPSIGGNKPNTTSEVRSTQRIAMNGVAVPASDSSYICRRIRVPQSTAHHIIELKAALNGTNTNTVNQMVLYGCPASQSGIESDQPFACDSAPASACNFLWAWTHDRAEFSLPTDAGIVTGQSTENADLVLIVNYVNPSLATDVVDYSGFSMTVSTSLARNNATWITFGVTPSTVNVPGNSDGAVISGECGSDATQEIIDAVPGDNVKVIASYARTNEHGTKVYADQFNESGEKTQTYGFATDYSYAHNAIVAADFRVKTRDRVVVTCEYDTTHHDAALVGGSSFTENELCQVSLLSYPAVPLTRRGCFGPQQ